MDDVCRSKDYMKQFCESLREHAMEIINFKNKNFIKVQKFTIFVKTSLKINILKLKSIVKLEILAIIEVNTEVLHIVYVI